MDIVTDGEGVRREGADSSLKRNVAVCVDIYRALVRTVERNGVTRVKHWCAAVVDFFNTGISL